MFYVKCFHIANPCFFLFSVGELKLESRKERKNRETIKGTLLDPEVIAEKSKGQIQKLMMKLTGYICG